MSDEAAAKFCAQLNGVPIVAPALDEMPPVAAVGVPPVSGLSSPVSDVEPVAARLVDSVSP